MSIKLLIKFTVHACTCVHSAIERNELVSEERLSVCVWAHTHSHVYQYTYLPTVSFIMSSITPFSAIVNISPRVCICI